MNQHLCRIETKESSSLRQTQTFYPYPKNFRRFASICVNHSTIRHHSRFFWDINKCIYHEENIWFLTKLPYSNTEHYWRFCCKYFQKIFWITVPYIRAIFESRSPIFSNGIVENAANIIWNPRITTRYFNTVVGNYFSNYIQRNMSHIRVNNDPIGCQ